MRSSFNEEPSAELGEISRRARVKCFLRRIRGGRGVVVVVVVDEAVDVAADDDVDDVDDDEVDVGASGVVAEDDEISEVKGTPAAAPVSCPSPSPPTLIVTTAPPCPALT